MTELQWQRTLSNSPSRAQISRLGVAPSISLSMRTETDTCLKVAPWKLQAAGWNKDPHMDNRRNIIATVLNSVLPRTNPLTT